MMKHSRMRALAFMLVLLTAVPAVASCAEKKDDTPASVTTQSVVTAAIEDLDSLEARKLVSDDVPEMSFDGAEYRIFYQKRYTTDAIPPEEEENGDILNDAVLARNRSAEERFEIKIVGIEGQEDAMVRTMMTTVGADEDAYELFMGHSIYSGAAALAGYFNNWYDIPYVDFTKPWFPQETIKELTTNDRMFMTMGDMALSAISNVYCMFFNKPMAESSNLPDIYEIVNSGEWTLDSLAELSKNMYVDLNGNSRGDLNDQFGFAGFQTNHPTTWLFACDIDTVEFDEDGLVTSVFNSERANIFLEKLRALYFDNEGSVLHVTKPGSDKELNTMFDQGRALFLTSGLGAAQDYFRDTDFEYGIIPFPKYDNAQDKYYTIPGGSVSCMAAPITVSNLELCGAVTAALCRESWVSVVPSYYDIVLKVKSVRDEASIAMLDLIMDGRMVSTAFLYDSYNGYYYQMSNLLSSKQGLSSFTAANDRKVVRHYEKVLELFYEN